MIRQQDASGAGSTSASTWQQTAAKVAAERSQARGWPVRVGDIVTVDPAARANTAGQYRVDQFDDSTDQQAWLISADLGRPAWASPQVWVPVRRLITSHGGV